MLEYALLLFFILILVVCLRDRKYKLPPQITGYGIPIISPMLAFAKNPRDLFQFCTKKYAKEGVARISIFGFVNFHIFFGPQFLEAFFRLPENELSLGEAAKFAVGPLLGDIDVAMSSEVVHKIDVKPSIKKTEEKAQMTMTTDWIRKAIQAPTQLDYMFDTASKVVNDYMTEFSKRETKTFDLFEEMYKLVVSINVRCFVGDEVEEYCDELVHLLWVIEYYGTTMKSLFNPLSSERRKSVNARHRLTEIIGKIRDKRLQNIKDGTHNGSRDVLQVNIDMGRTDASIVASLLGLFFAAQTNTVSTSAWTLAYLATHPEWQEKIRNEIPSEELTHEDCKDLVQLGASLSETVRKNALAFMFRKALKNINVEGVTIKKGDYCIISPSILHMNESLYPNPEQWNPERFLKDGGNYKTAALKFGKNFVQWGFHSHRCLGEQFATLVMKITVTNFIRRYKLSTSDKLELDFSKALGMPFAKGHVMIRAEPL
ncbi:CYP88D6 [Acrasis kona]|uniref:CYP88D6 n=1 Tax=Acrasis kona TaxID=1008807 RepID=A0AAW2YJ68_9EUKA